MPGTGQQQEHNMASPWRTAPLPPGWKTTRRAILQRDHHTCTTCGQHATHVDHITPASQGGDDHPANLTSLCSTCHRHKTAGEANAARWTPQQRRARTPEAHPGTR